MTLKLETGTKLVAATHNPGKAKELAALLDGRFEVLAAGALGLPEPDETETTFVGNALLKARHAARLIRIVDAVATRMATLTLIAGLPLAAVTFAIKTF